MAKSKKKGNKKQKPDKKTKSSKMSYEKYVEELEKLEVELVKLQGWIKHKELKVVVIFEGRDAAGKGGRHQTARPLEFNQPLAQHDSL